MGVREVRQLLAPENPFAIGKYPDRLAPAHIMNGFVAAALGISPRGHVVRDLLARRSTTLDEEARKVPFLRRAEWADDPDRVSAFRSDFSLAFNADSRMWEKFGSLSLVHASLAISNPEDDNLGRLLWALMNRHGPPDTTQRLKALLSPAEAYDPITGAALLLVAEAEPAAPTTARKVDDCWFGSSATPAGEHLAKSLAEFIWQLAEPIDDARRLQRIQHLARGLQLAAVLAIALGPLTWNITGTVSETDSIASLVGWAGVPPGPPGDPMVLAAQRSYKVLVERMSEALATQLEAALRRVPLPSHLPPSQEWRERFLAQLAAGGLTRTQAEKSVVELEKDAWVKALVNGTGGSYAGVPGRIGSELIQHGYPKNELPYGLRRIGRKVGFIGPERSTGAPRFICETPLLGTLVAGLCPREGIDFEGFVDAMRTRLGIVFGNGTRDDLAKQLGLWESAGIGHARLSANQEALRQRLVRSGLAREYSDGHTEVVHDN